jgi:hypothetical protein
MLRVLKWSRYFITASEARETMGSPSRVRPVGLAERELELVPEVHGHGTNVARRSRLSAIGYQ